MRQDALHRTQTPSTRARGARVADALLLANLSETTGISETQLQDWLASGLIRTRADPSAPSGSFELTLRDAVRVRSLCETPALGRKTVALRRTLDRIRAWMPTSLEPLGVITLVGHRGALLVRLRDGRLADPFDQFRFTLFDGPGSTLGRLMPTTPQSWHDRGIEQELAGDFPAAIESYGRALRLGGPDVQICFDLAHALAEAGESIRAMERYRQVIEIDPLRADAWLNLADLLSDAGQPADAIDALRHALDLDPDDPATHYALAEALDVTGQTEEAMSHYKALSRLGDPSDERVLYANARRCGIDAFPLHLPLAPRP